MNKVSKDIISTLNDTVLKAHEFIKRCDHFMISCKTKYTKDCDAQVDKDILDVNILLESVDRLADLLAVHIKFCDETECGTSSINCTKACKDLMNTINDLISYCKDEEAGCATRYQSVRNECENLIIKSERLSANFCDK